jgi:hypothetical protein
VGVEDLGGGQSSSVRSSQPVGVEDLGGGQSSDSGDRVGRQSSAASSSQPATVTVKSVTTNKNIIYRVQNNWLSKYVQMKAKPFDCCSFHGCFQRSNKTPCKHCTVNSGPLALVIRFCGAHNNHKVVGHMTELESFGLWVDILMRSENLRGYFGVTETQEAFLKLSVALHSANIAPSTFIFTKLKDMQQLCDDITCLIV